LRYSLWVSVPKQYSEKCPHEKTKGNLYLLQRVKSFWYRPILRARSCAIWRPVVWYRGICFGLNSCLFFHHFWKLEAAGASSTSVYINQTTWRHIPPDRSIQLLYEYSQDTGNASAEIRRINVGWLAAPLLVTQTATYTYIQILFLLYITVGRNSRRMSTFRRNSYCHIHKPNANHQTTEAVEYNWNI
jgi:hypothetical protein